MHHLSTYNHKPECILMELYLTDQHRLVTNCVVEEKKINKYLIF